MKYGLVIRFRNGETAYLEVDTWEQLMAELKFYEPQRADILSMVIATFKEGE